MTIASRFLSANSEDAAMETSSKKKTEDKEKERRNPPVTVSEPDLQQFHPNGRPGQISVKVRKAVALPLVSGPVHRFVEVEYSGEGKRGLTDLSRWSIQVRGREVYRLLVL